ncbi:MAG TPA: PAS domain S-box protein [Nevskiaceae bacterium]|nr:PAS domain S-box protein [Nevskiaceae bacterium]
MTPERDTLFSVAGPDPETQMGPALQHAFDRACRDLVEDADRGEMLRRLCGAVAESLGLVMVSLVQRSEGGLMRMVASSTENRLWTEFARLPERWDGTIAGHGPAAQVLHTHEPALVSVAAEGFLPWRNAAEAEGIASVCAWPLPTEAVEWVLSLFGDRDVRFDDERLRRQIRGVAKGFARILDDGECLARERLLAQALAGSGNPAFIADAEGRIQWCNAAFSRMSGYALDEIRGRNPRFLSSGHHGPQYYRELWDTICSGNVWHGKTVDRDREGVAFTTMQTITPLGHGKRPTHYLAIYEDVSRQQEKQRRREMRSGSEPLAELTHPAALQFAMAGLLSAGKPLSVGLISLRNLAKVAARLGEGAQDTLLDECRERIRGRLGAEHAAMNAAGEFLLWLPSGREEAIALLDGLRRDLVQPFPLIGDIPDLELRAGIACAPEDGRTLEDLLRHADRALGIEPLEAARCAHAQVH